MFEVEDASVPSGTVVQVMQAGYLIGERVLRPALVAVSKGGREVCAGRRCGTARQRQSRRTVIALAASAARDRRARRGSA